MDFGAVDIASSSGSNEEARGEANSMEIGKENEGLANHGSSSLDISMTTEVMSKLGRLADQFQHVTVDIQKLSSSIKQMEVNNRKGKSVLEHVTVEKPLFHFYHLNEKCSIFRIPEVLIRHTLKSYLPIVFVLGPWVLYSENGQPRNLGNDVQLGTNIQANYLYHFFRQIPGEEGYANKLDELIKAVKEDEGVQEARACYQGLIRTSENMFIGSLVRSGCFILEFLYRYSKSIAERDWDPIFSKAYMMKCLCHDLILLENQIPWFVLKRIYDLTKRSETARPLDRMVIEYFKGTFFDVIYLDRVPLTREPIHIVDLLREFLVSSLMEAENSDAATTTNSSKINVKRAEEHSQTSELEMKLPSASRLQEAGIKFVRGKPNATLLNVKFQNGVFTIPRLLVHDNTETFFRNLVCFEQCYSGGAPIISSYAKIMDNLVDTVEDLEILCKSGVIHNSLDPEEAVKVFNRLYTDTSNNGLYYRDLYWDVNSYCGRLIPSWRAAYVQNYFTKPWAIASQLFALLILVLTILQVVPSIKQL